jgi:saccharopine dehydrogenase-like NADP-dependent oxidoreductase
MSEVYSKNKITVGEPVYYGKDLVGYTFDDPNSIDGKRFYPLEHLNEIINNLKRIFKQRTSSSDHYNTIKGVVKGGSRKRARRNSKKHKRVRHTRRKQTRRHRHSRRR